MIKFPTINESRCNDGECCGDPPKCLPKKSLRLVLKPGAAVFPVGRSIQLVPYFESPAGDIRIFQGVTYKSTAPTVAVVNSLGLVTTLQNGSATILAYWENLEAACHVTVAASNPLAIELCVDTSNSMNAAFNEVFHSKLDAARGIALAVSFSLDLSNNSAGLIAFTTYANEIASLSSNPVTNRVLSNIQPTTAKTHFWPLLGTLNFNMQSADGQGVAIIISDGLDNEMEYSRKDALSAAGLFRKAGGVIICCGIRAQGSGYEFLQKLATPGYFINVFGEGDSVGSAAASNIMGLLGYVGGSSVILPCGAISPDLDIVRDPEDGCLKSGFDSTQTVTLSNPSGTPAETIYSSASAMSNVSQADADERAALAARIAGDAAMNLAIAGTTNYGVQAFAGGGPPTFQRPASGAGVYFDYVNEILVEWDNVNDCWEGHPGTGGGQLEILRGQQAFFGSGPPTTQRPANGAGTYYDIVNKVESHWDARNECWFGHPGTGSGGTVAINTVSYFEGNGSPISGGGPPPGNLIPGGTGGQYYDLTNKQRWNWNGTTYE